MGLQTPVESWIFPFSRKSFELAINQWVLTERHTELDTRYCPLGRGMLTGKLQSFDDLDEKDIRRMFPRYHRDNFEVNLKLVKEIAAMAAKKGCTPAQLALGWLVTLSKKDGMPEIIPIPGASM